MSSFHQWFHIRLLFRRLSILVLLYAVCRVLFFFFNKDLFPELTLTAFLQVMWYGLRFDVASIVLINSLFILLHIVPNPWRETPKYQLAAKLVFYAFNGVALMMESGDFIYFRYGLKRTTTHELGLANDVEVIPMVIRDFWFIFIIVLVLVAIVEVLYRKTEFTRRPGAAPVKATIHYPTQFIWMVAILSMTVVGARGGLQPRPISPSNAGAYVNNEMLSELVINTPFSVLYALGHRKLKEPAFFKEEEWLEYYSPYHEGVDFYTDTCRPNICLVVLESFSKEYIGYFNNGKGYTPFLDSMLGQGRVFTNFYANGKSSNQGIVATVSGIPVLMEEPFLSSLYKDNAFNGIGSLLQQEGYYSAFYHGANNGSMGFDKFTQRAGFNAYYGRDEYGDDTYFDGNWGIFDEPFLQFTAKSLSGLPEPFFAEVFTISSHHPFTLPVEYIDTFPKGSIPMLEVVGYTDHALREFFQLASKQPWYEHTIFILTADHTGPPEPDAPFYKNQLGAHSTWMLLYEPGGEFIGEDERAAQQTDIFATILDLSGYKGAYFAFGHSLLDPEWNGMAFSLHSGNYMLVEGDTALITNGVTRPQLYHFPSDSLLNMNLAGTDSLTSKQMEATLKAVIQAHHHSMIKNKLIAH